jgi:hypothetical protein
MTDAESMNNIDAFLDNSVVITGKILLALIAFIIE